MTGEPSSMLLGCVFTIAIRKLRQVDFVNIVGKANICSGLCDDSGLNVTDDISS
jgi:hypothetical protein